MLLSVIAGPDKGRSVQLEAGVPLVIGRGEDAQFMLNDPATSRKHCSVVLQHSQVTVSDLQSRSGTLVNNVVVTDAKLKSGDVIRVGDTQLRYQAGSVEAVSTISPQVDRNALKKSPTDEAALDKLVGKKLSHYDVIRVIAKGNSGMVFEAKDTRDGKQVALKVLWPAMAADEEQMQRFVRGMRAMAPIHHENIVRLYDAAKNGPYVWLAMEFVDGEKLSKVIERIGVAGMLDWKQAFWVAVHIGRALEAAYERKIVHRNLSPANILLRKKDNVAKLADLMFAKALEGVHAINVTRPGQLIGDLAYMAPERTYAEDQLDCRSDIYELGATVYALLTGRPPHAGKSTVELLHSVRQGEPEKPRKFQLSVPDMFEGVVLKMLAKRPEDRFETPTALLKDLKRVGMFSGITL